jgi:acyl carrier protein
MEKQKILSQVQDIFRDVLDDEAIVLTEETSANDVEGWDSLSHIQLIVAIEKHFKIKFTSKEILSWKNVGEMIGCIAGRIGNA